ncbi:hypothetical protein [Lutibacter sp.]|uniref:hypothetical protein n=1 Tax=Lutibacter sp. TaxID=1925666 RepID=UPI001A32ECD6|nr:hypothetical protein [Lutibacter sp.]MBI9041242.1 hypothetical protein [Lutibacter sp.]
MKNKLLYFGLIIGISVGAFLLSADKVDVCHVPPGNPENAHTINIARVAAYVHIALHEGDTMGACGSNEGPER